MYGPRSVLFGPLLGLLALSPSISATPTPQSSNDAIAPIPTPDFSHCIFPAIVFPSIDSPFTLSAFSDVLPLVTYAVFIGTPSAETITSPDIAFTKQAQPLFTLTNGFLNTTGLNGETFPGRFVPSPTLSPLQNFVFGGQGDPSNFFALMNCDATGTPYLELSAARQLVAGVEDSESLNIIYGKESEEVYPGKYETIHLRINGGRPLP